MCEERWLSLWRRRDGKGFEMGQTSIQWTNKTWSPLRVKVRHDAARIAEEKGYTSLIEIGKTMAGHIGPHCEAVSQGCTNCYSQTNNHRCLPANGTGLPFDRRSRDLVAPFVDERILLQPLRWKSPQKIFVENQSDLFGEWVREEDIDRVFAVMVMCHQHTFQVLTKRPERMLKWFDNDPVNRMCGHMAWINRHKDNSIATAAATFRAMTDERWPLGNVWMGISCEDWKTAEERAAILRKVPAHVRFISQEPQIDSRIEWTPEKLAGISWLVQGGESGPGARTFDLKWARTALGECRAAGVAYFLKQVGAKPIDSDYSHWGHRMRIGDGNQEYNRYVRVKLKDRKGGDMSEWPESLRVREFPLQSGAPR